MKKNIVKALYIVSVLLAFLLALLLVVCTPLAILACCSLRLPEQYGQTYYAAMKLKLDRLGDTPGARLVVIGGSSTAFGIDSKIAEAELGMPCVNFGLYAAFGLKVMLDLSLADLHEGDIVVIAPELSSQMYSDYVGYSYLLQALEGRPGMYTRLGGDYVAGFLHALPAYYAEKQRFAREGSPRPEGVYSVGAFDSFGDVVYDRPENIMDGMVAADSLPEIGPELVTDSFAEMINGVFELHRRDHLWDDRLLECRELVGQQMAAVGDIMQMLSGQMAVDCIFLEGAEGAWCQYIYQICG